MAHATVGRDAAHGPASPDLLPWVVGAVALVTFSLHGFHGRLSHDLGVYTYAGQQVADGVPP